MISGLCDCRVVCPGSCLFKVCNRRPCSYWWLTEEMGLGEEASVLRFLVLYSFFDTQGFLTGLFLVHSCLLESLTGRTFEAVLAD